MPGPVSLSREAAGANLPCLSQAPVEYAAMIYGQLRRIRLFRLTAKKGGALLATAGLFFCRYRNVPVVGSGDLARPLNWLMISVYRGRRFDEQAGDARHDNLPMLFP